MPEPTLPDRKLSFFHPTLTLIIFFTLTTLEGLDLILGLGTMLSLGPLKQTPPLLSLIQRHIPQMKRQQPLRYPYRLCVISSANAKAYLLESKQSNLLNNLT